MTSYRTSAKLPELWTYNVGAQIDRIILSRRSRERANGPPTTSSKSVTAVTRSVSESTKTFERIKGLRTRQFRWTFSAWPVGIAHLF